MADPRVLYLIAPRSLVVLAQLDLCLNQDLLWVFPSAWAVMQPPLRVSKDELLHLNRHTRKLLWIPQSFFLRERWAPHGLLLTQQVVKT
jgi:hypothetical protein